MAERQIKGRLGWSRCTPSIRRAIESRSTIIRSTIESRSSINPKYDRAEDTIIRSTVESRSAIDPTCDRSEVRSFEARRPSKARSRAEARLPSKAGSRAEAGAIRSTTHPKHDPSEADPPEVRFIKKHDPSDGIEFSMKSRGRFLLSLRFCFTLTPGSRAPDRNMGWCLWRRS